MTIVTAIYHLKAQSMFNAVGQVLSGVAKDWNDRKLVEKGQRTRKGRLAQVLGNDRQHKQ